VNEAAAGRWSVLSLLRTTAAFLEDRGVAEARLSAEHLLAHVLGCRRLDLYLRYDRPVAATEIRAYREAIRRRLRGEPVQYITGTAGFRGHDLAVDPRVLIPRPETELLVGEVLAWARSEARRGRTPPGGWRILDLGTGSGAIAIALAAELEGTALVVGSDQSSAATLVARANAVRAGAKSVHFVAGEGFSPFRSGPRFDAVVANPPYLADRERATLPREVRDWEPAEALFAGPRGDEAIERIVSEAPGYLRAGGILALEVALGQGPLVRERIRGVPRLALVGSFRDHGGIERGVLALAREE
jgi:release factor glutamine methyltransferase